jgi:hypothetical protein
MKARIKAESVIITVLVGWFLCCSFFQLNFGLADNGDYTDVMRWVTPGPYGIEPNWPISGTQEFERRFFNYWIPFWKLQWNLPAGLPPTSAFLLWLPGAFLNYVLYSRTVLYLPFVALFPRLLLLGLLILLFKWAVAQTQHRWLFMLGVVAPVALLITASGYAVYFNTFYKETASFIFLLLFLASLVLLKNRTSVIYLLISLLLLLLLATSKASYLYWPFLGMPFVFLAWSWARGVRWKWTLPAALLLAIVFAGVGGLLATKSGITERFPYVSLFSGALNFSGRSSWHLQALGLKDASQCINSVPFYEPGASCFAMYYGRMTYLNTLRVILAEPAVLFRMIRYGFTNMHHVNIGWGNFAYDDPRALVTAPLESGTGSQVGLMNSWMMMKEAVFPKGSAMAAMLLVSVAWFGALIRRAGSLGDISLVGLLSALGCLLDITVAVVGGGVVDIHRHLLLANVLFDVAAIAFFSSGIAWCLERFRHDGPQA